MEASNYVRPGGFLYYITCSVLLDENIEQIRRFLRMKEEEFVLVKRETLMPQTDGNDGFFIATLERRR
jgi:16S rRNA (cytosine967-C5)-methyltransferase